MINFDISFEPIMLMKTCDKLPSIIGGPNISFEPIMFMKTCDKVDPSLSPIPMSESPVDITIQIPQISIVCLVGDPATTKQQYLEVKEKLNMISTEEKCTAILEYVVKQSLGEETFEQFVDELYNYVK